MFRSWTRFCRLHTILGFSCAAHQKVFVESALSALISTLFWNEMERFGARDDEASIGGLVAVLKPVCVVRCFSTRLADDFIYHSPCEKFSGYYLASTMFSVFVYSS